MKKKIILFCSVLLLAGCVDKALSNIYNNMQVNDKNINGYTLDLEIRDNKTNLNDTIMVDNYKNTEYEILINHLKISDGKVETVENVIYIKDSLVYVQNENGKYIETKDEVKYSNPSIYLEGLKNIKKGKKSTTEKIGGVNYTVYDVTIKASTVNRIISDTNLNKTVKDDIKAKVYLEENKSLYKIIYYIDNNSYIDATYISINKSRSIIFPDEI